MIYVKDLAAMTAFYAQTFDLVEVESDPSFVVLADAAWELSLVAILPAIAADVVVSVPPRRRAETPIKLAFDVVEIEALRSPIASAGGTMEPPDRAWEFRGRRHLDSLDPEGNVVQLRQPI
ncbi:MAG: hypothetical protein JWM34_4454 [Ilumatobacteraceae bacterium]|nr:hypothetical protein [Ilumatobacteraceae bacterium]